MSRWLIDDTEEIVLPDLTSVRTALVGGDIAVTTATGPARLEVRRLHGDPVEVRFDDGELFVGYDTEFGLNIGPLNLGGAGLLEDIGDLVSGLVGFIGRADERRLRHGFRHGFGLRNQKATVALTVPPEAALDLVALSASVLVAGSESPVRVKTVSGDVTLDGVTGPVNVHLLSGDLEAQGLAGDLKVNSASGDVTLVQSSCPSVTVTTISGDVTIDCDRAGDGRYEMRTVSGDVAIWLPADGVVDVDAASVSGRVDADDGLTAEYAPGRRHVFGRMGEGDATISLRVKTVAGDLTVLRRETAAS